MECNLTICPSEQKKFENFVSMLQYSPFLFLFPFFVIYRIIFGINYLFYSFIFSFIQLFVT